jgi:hypothetical protein
MISLFQAPDGAQRMTLRLQPDDLGHVEIRIETPSNGPTRVEITVEKQDTLNLMLHDQAQLQRALDQAGLPADGRSVTFHIAPPESLLSTGSQPHFQSDASGGPLGTYSGSDGQWASGEGGGGSRQAGGQGGGGSGREGGGPGGGQAGGGGEDTYTPGWNPQAARWLRAGLDITA